ncbi:Membrane-associated ATPase C chain [uncultured archaeon]|nr:Membrane-associated ATPase C chain [uncultured archaeon]
MVSIDVGKEICAALAIGMAAMASAYAIAATGSAAANAVKEKPETSGKVLLFVALAEAIAIYGLVVSLMILFQ